MPKAKKLSHFDAEPEGDGVKLTIEADDGSSLEVDATFEQLEVITDALDEILFGHDDVADEKAEDA